MDMAEQASAPAQGAGAYDTEPHPWRRYGARIIDHELFGGLILVGVGVLIGVFGSDALFDFVTSANMWLRLLVYTPLAWILTAPIVALLLAKFGTTPGKILFGIRVVPAEGGRLTFRRALKREALLLLWGIGFGIPVWSFVAILTSFESVDKGNAARWDEATDLTVEARRVAGWQLVGVIVGTAVVGASLVWNAVERIVGSAGL